MEQLANGTGLLPEQVWDRHFRSNGIDYFGRPTGSAMPLVWAHAEYIKLVRSAKEGRVFDLMPEVADHYRNHPRHRERYAMWTLHYPTRVAHPGETLRVYAANRFRLRYSLDNWATTEDKNSRDAELDVHFVDVDVPRDQRMPARFTFFWEKRQSWHGSDFAVAIEPERDAR
jgi:glucoamylase